MPVSRASCAIDHPRPLEERSNVRPLRHSDVECCTAAAIAEVTHYLTL